MPNKLLEKIPYFPVKAKEDCIDFAILQGEYKISVTFEILIYVRHKEWLHHTLYCTDTQIIRFQINVVDDDYCYRILESQHAIFFQNSLRVVKYYL